MSAPPLAERRFRHPDTGAEAVLRVDTIPQPGGNPPWYELRVARPDGQGTVPRIMYATWARTRGQARKLWAERERELRALSYRRQV
jgi:hypothetical protein